MATRVEIGQAQDVWGTFERDREHLFRQFQEIPWADHTGLTAQELATEVAAYLRDHADQPKVLQKAGVFALVMKRARIAIDPLDWFVDKLDHGDLVRKVRDAWYEEAKAGALKKEASWFDEVWNYGLVHGLLDMGHISPGWEKVFAGGLVGLLDEVRQAREHAGDAATPEQRAFWQAVEIVYEAAIALANRFADLAEALVAEHPAQAPRLLAIAECCRRIPAHGPTTFYEALQFHWFLHEWIEMEGELVRSAGHFDRHLYPYYRADIDAGRLTREQAKELIKFFWFKHASRTQGLRNGKNYVFAGQDRDGSIIDNELTYLALEAYGELNTPDPKLSVRFTPETPDRLYYTVADLIRHGHNSFVLMNDVPAIAGLLKRGKTLPDARSYLPIGCYEPAVDGKEAACTMNLVINLAKGLELALHDGRDPVSGVQLGPHTGDPRTFGSFEDLFDAYRRQMDFIIARSITYVGAHERQWPQINPSPFLAGTIDDCIATGKDIGQGGPRYNSVGVVGMGLANTVDGLLGVKRAVFDEGRCTMEELLTALGHNYEGHEPLRQYLLNRVPKWGNNDAESDALARRVADYYCHKVHTFRNGRGGACQAALFSLDYQWRMGRHVGALPDGRRAFESLAPGVGPSSGRDKSGVTALLNSVSSLDFTETPNGSVLDVMLHPSAVRGQDGLDAFVQLIKTFFAQGGYAVQFNVLDTDTLRKAQRYPERYASLQIRVTGWSVYWVALTREEQDQFIARHAHTLS
ncbi:MAG: hypothetical protein H5T69_01595 [Chloroflexi bacterium]|nr:hypothetical protein [Chloroflexota bacterium]